ncbi:hypothetical protein NM688_g6732 [Phlebia brevispora]|uniref:Uncharacterized protein n=1 Tax=Phlebia brevispora TaxID=194682 RepID=A0ACC1SD22_9APHY|nr:hypothetical protein NM688_g6732 [Phlebia brevispora]
MPTEIVYNPKEHTAESSSHHNEGPSSPARSTDTPSPTQSTIPGTAHDDVQPNTPSSPLSPSSQANIVDDDVRSNAPEPEVRPIPVPDYADDDVWSVGGRSPSSPMSPVPDRFEEDAEDDKENRHEATVADRMEDQDDKENRNKTMAGDTIKGQINEEDESKYVTSLSSVAARTYEDGGRQVARSLVIRIPPKVHGIDTSNGDANDDQMVRPTWIDKGKGVDRRSYDLRAPSYKFPPIAKCDEHEETPELTREQSVASTSSTYLASPEQLGRSCDPGCSQKASSSGIHINTPNEDSSENRVAPAPLSNSTAAPLSTSNTGDMEMLLNYMGTKLGLSREDSIDLTSDALLPSKQGSECTSIQPTFAHPPASQTLPRFTPGNFTFATPRASEQLPRFALPSSASTFQLPTRGRPHRRGNAFNKRPQPTPVQSTFGSPPASERSPPYTPLHSVPNNSIFAAPLPSQEPSQCMPPNLTPAHPAFAIPPAPPKPPQYPPSNFTSAHPPFAIPPASPNAPPYTPPYLTPANSTCAVASISQEPPPYTPLSFKPAHSTFALPPASYKPPQYTLTDSTMFVLPDVPCAAPCELSPQFRDPASKTSCVDLLVAIPSFTFGIHDCEKEKTDGYPPDDPMDVDPPVCVDDDAMDVDPPADETISASMSASTDALDLSCNESLGRGANNVVGIEGRQYMHPEASTSCTSYTLPKDPPTAAQWNACPSSLDHLRPDVENNTDKNALFNQHSDGNASFYKALCNFRRKKPAEMPLKVSVVSCPMPPTSSANAKSSHLCMRHDKRASRHARSIRISPYRLRALKVSVVPCPMAPTTSASAKRSHLCVRHDKQASRHTRSIRTSPYGVEGVEKRTLNRWRAGTRNLDDLFTADRPALTALTVRRNEAALLETREAYEHRSLATENLAVFFCRTQGGQDWSVLPQWLLVGTFACVTLSELEGRCGLPAVHLACARGYSACLRSLKAAYVPLTRLLSACLARPRTVPVSLARRVPEIRQWERTFDVSARAGDTSRSWKRHHEEEVALQYARRSAQEAKIVGPKKNHVTEWVSRCPGPSLAQMSPMAPFAYPSSTSACVPIVSSPLAPRANASPHTRIVPKKSKLGLLVSEPKPSTTKQCLCVAAGVGNSSDFEIDVAPQETPDLGKIVNREESEVAQWVERDAVGFRRTQRAHDDPARTEGEGESEEALGQLAPRTQERREPELEVMEHWMGP